MTHDSEVVTRTPFQRNLLGSRPEAAAERMTLHFCEARACHHVPFYAKRQSVLLSYQSCMKFTGGKGNARIPLVLFENLLNLEAI